MKSLFFALVLFASSVQAAIPFGDYYKLTNPNTGLLNHVSIEARFVNTQRVWIVKWEVIDKETSVITKYCRLVDLSDLHLHQLLEGRGPQSLGYLFVLWQLGPNSQDPWCLQ